MLVGVVPQLCAIIRFKSSTTTTMIIIAILKIKRYITGHTYIVVVFQFRSILLTFMFAPLKCKVPVLVDQTKQSNNKIPPLYNIVEKEIVPLHYLIHIMHNIKTSLQEVCIVAPHYYIMEFTSVFPPPLPITNANQ